MKRKIQNKKEKGSFLVLSALAIIALIGFLALGIEVGQWYLVKAELSKAVDAASLMGAKNISNPYVNLSDLTEEIALENFAAGFVGTPVSGGRLRQFSIFARN